MDQQQDHIDASLLCTLSRRYEDAIERIVDEFGWQYQIDRPKKQPSLPPELYHLQLSNLQRQIDELQAALADVKEQLKQVGADHNLQPALAIALNVPPLSTEDCTHWTQLLQTHIRVIRVLELDEAKQGSEFHYAKRIELEERNKRVTELQQQIAQNCQ